MDDELNLLAFNLFKNLARFEYALKAAEFHRGDGAAKPDWRGFAESVAEVFDDPNEGKRCFADTFIMRA